MGTSPCKYTPGKIVSGGDEGGTQSISETRGETRILASTAFFYIYIHTYKDLSFAERIVRDAVHSRVEGGGDVGFGVRGNKFYKFWGVSVRARARSQLYNFGAVVAFAPVAEAWGLAEIRRQSARYIYIYKHARIRLVVARYNNNNDNNDSTVIVIMIITITSSSFEGIIQSAILSRARRRISMRLEAEGRVIIIIKTITITIMIVVYI